MSLAWNQTVQSRHRLLEQGLFGNEAQKLLWTGAPAQWPKTFATAAGKNKRVDRIGHVDEKNRSRRIMKSANISRFLFSNESYNT